MTNFQAGQVVRAFYKTGAYIGEITADKGSHYVVQIKTVLKHPRQGDLHNPNEVNVPFFHERKALAFNERTNIPSNMIKAFEGEVADYFESLKSSVNMLENELQDSTSDFNAKSLEALQGVKKEYELMYSISFA
ncbi:kinase-associated lipoprotein B [Jeotgalibacillus soli]|uniref:Kinase n=1 Tax=Jeotgalibacillus soli TaxID=889306 RepID=A0A0C2V0K2_9BACL|nr:kinase-associated lipoprotein B [Jeotgalibacillus soli]KIL42592.1 kinase [Jeotgalibacillus soli]